MLFCVTCENDIKRDTEVTPIASMANEMKRVFITEKSVTWNPSHVHQKKKKKVKHINQDGSWGRGESEGHFYK